MIAAANDSCGHGEEKWRRADAGPCEWQPESGRSAPLQGVRRPMPNDEDRQRETESRRIIERVSREAQSDGRSAIDRAANRARDHLAASDVDRDDWAEHWGTRIGRTIGALLLVALIAWLVIYLSQGM
jgi:hypothetical protein